MQAPQAAHSGVSPAFQAFGPRFHHTMLEKRDWFHCLSVYF